MATAAPAEEAAPVAVDLVVAEAQGRLSLPAQLTLAKGATNAKTPASFWKRAFSFAPDLFDNDLNPQGGSN